MVKNTKLLMVHLRKKLFKPLEKNRQMSMLVVGPIQQGELLDHLLKDDEKAKDDGRNEAESKPFLVLLVIFPF